MSDKLPHPPKAVIFDWDNTLVDSWGTIQAALNMTFDDFGKDRWTLDETKQRVARSLRDSFPVLFGEDRWEAAKDSFYAHFRSIHLETLTPLAGAYDLLCALRDNGTYIGVVSNKNGDFLRKEAKHLEWTPFFGKIVGATDAPNDKPAPDPVHMAMGDSSASQYENLWFVGDSVVDIQCARNVGATAILIGDELTGHSETQNSATLSPDWHFADCEALVRVVKGFSKVL
ncbi:HAD family hydrolase [Thalassospira povalilytica]|uniref:phosphoglycolate phosphatase n=1 Tax=Thalassospira povalilytica TaxID=732237 RepID=A0A8I1SKE9_9PROT|nr:HAD family hydrolase [Thalassospira povalilytica]MBN8197351.1 HAD family hydrolase [Thalassospira povalilytica]